MKSELIYLISNFILTCYGLLIKSYKDVELIEQIYIRTLVFTLLSLALLKFNVLFSSTTIWLGIINFISIYGIYVAFEKLGIGITQALFYSWPLLFYIISDKQFNFGDLSILVITFLFVLLIYKPINNENEKNKDNQKYIGLLGVFASIITHVYILNYYKLYKPPIEEYLYNQYAFILIVFSIYFLWKYFKNKKTIHDKIQSNYKTFSYILVFNLLLGYLGFYLQFFSVGQLQPYIISLLTFISIIISLFIDKLVFQQIITNEQWMGIIGIITMTALFRKD